MSKLASPDALKSNSFNAPSKFGRPNMQNLTPNSGSWLRGMRDHEEEAVTLGAAEIASMLAEEVHGGILEVGAMLPSERDLCDRFGVGRTMARLGADSAATGPAGGGGGGGGGSRLTLSSKTGNWL